MIAITLVFFALNGVLLYARSTAELWLLGSVVMGVIWGVIFPRLITNEAGTKAG